MRFILNRITTLLYYSLIFPFYKLTLGSLHVRGRIYSPLKIAGRRNIHIGKCVYINYRVWLEASPINKDTDCRLEIGDGCNIGNFNHIFVTRSVILGKNVLTADKVYISDCGHEYTDVSLPILHQPVKQLRNVIIGDGAWLGENVCVIGASVGKGSVVGANSVVTRDIPDFSVAVGSPAKVVKRYSFEKKEWLKTNEEGEFLETRL
ncbi:acyltransferase [Chitinophaga ginsengisegetis]|uniref:acyltransferase n=1 Tax=Chitinophaga ginsengisegetis TaxID=393003 RepID=UPI003421825A